MESYNQIKKLIQERELKENHLEEEEKLSKEVIQNSKSALAYGLLSQIYYWKGEVAEKKDKHQIYETGVEFGKMGIHLDNKNLESQFWLSVCLGLLAEEKGILNSIFLLPSMESSMNSSLAIDKSYFYGGPLRVASMFYFRIPPWPLSKGDKRKSLEYILEALKYGPEFYLNHLYASQIYKSLGERKKAIEHLEWILNAEPTRKFQKENERYKLQARKELEII
jgi:tetratricopeptide (TPR) repeat protein